MSIFIKLPFLRNKRFTDPLLWRELTAAPKAQVFGDGQAGRPLVSPSLLASPVHPGLQLDHQRLSAFTTLLPLKKKLEHSLMAIFMEILIEEYENQS